MEENIMTERKIQTCTYELCCEPSYFAWPHHCKKHYLFRTSIRGEFNDLRLEQFLDLASERNAMTGEWSIEEVNDITNNLEQIPHYPTCI